MSKVSSFTFKSSDSAENWARSTHCRFGLLSELPGKISMALRRRPRARARVFSSSKSWVRIVRSSLAIASSMPGESRRDG